MTPFEPLDRDGRLDATVAAFLEACDRGAHPDPAAFAARHADLQPDLAAALARHARLERLAAAPPGPDRDAGPTLRTTLGTTLGPYVLEAELGRGGMGAVLRARHVHLGRTVAIKIVPERLARVPQLVDRLRREARALARIEHPHVVRVHDLGVDAGRYFVVMEHVDGADLRARLAQGRLAPDRALEIVEAVAQGLACVHAAGIVHRDIKPENILLTRNGEPKLADFGLARVADPDPGLAALTRTDMRMGTYDYMAPEQKRSADVDTRADVYALGVVLYEALTGRLPDGRFAPPGVLLAAVAPGEAPLDARVDDVVLRALAADPADRYASAAEFAAAIGAARRTGSAGPVVAAAMPLAPGERDATGVGCVVIRVDDESSVTIRAWRRDVVGVRSDDGEFPDDLAWSHDPAGARLTVTLGDFEDWVVHVPARIAVHVAAPEGDVEAVGLGAAMSVEGGAGSVTVRDHRGPLVIERDADGDITVIGYAGQDLDLRTQDGPIRVDALGLTAGRATLRADDGRVRVQCEPSAADLHYDARSLRGAVVVELPGVALREPRAVRGTLRAGRARLEIVTGGGPILLTDSRRSTADPYGWSIAWACAAGIAWWLGWTWTALGAAAVLVTIALAGSLPGAGRRGR